MRPLFIERFWNGIVITLAAAFTLVLAVPHADAPEKLTQKTRQVWET